MSTIDASIVIIICEFIMSVMVYGTLYALLGYVYAQGKRIGRASATAPTTNARVRERRGESVCVASVDVLADGYAVEVSIRGRAPERSEVECCGGAHPPPHGAEDPYVLLRCWRACMAGTRPSDWELIVSHLLIDTEATLAYADAIAREREWRQRREEECCGGAHPPPPPRPSAHLSPSAPSRWMRGVRAAERR